MFLLWRVRYCVIHKLFIFCSISFLAVACLLLSQPPSIQGTSYWSIHDGILVKWNIPWLIVSSGRKCTEQFVAIASIDTRAFTQRISIHFYIIVPLCIMSVSTFISYLYIGKQIIGDSNLHTSFHLSSEPWAGLT